MGFCPVGFCPDTGGNIDRTEAPCLADDIRRLYGVLRARSRPGCRGEMWNSDSAVEERKCRL